MKNKTIVFSLALSILCVVVYATRTGRGQTQQRSSDAVKADAQIESNVKPTAAIRERRTLVDSAAELSAFANAARQNSLLKDGLAWTFGGKQQRGWRLYTGLLESMLGTEAEASTPEFAHALASWQKRMGLSPTGALDDKTLYKIISVWQAARLNSSAYPSDDELVTAPASDFWDPARPEELRRVRRDAYDAYKLMIADAAKDPSLKLAVTETGELAPHERYLKIVSSFRSREYQEELRRRSPNAGRAGLAVNSPHFTGCALDLYVGGDPVDTKDANRLLQVQTPVYQWLVKNAHKYGFRPYYYEPWHWEYVGGKQTTGGGN